MPWSDLLTALLPPACAGCDVLLPPGDPPFALCDRCRAESPVFAPSERTVGGVTAVAPLVGPLAAAYGAYKATGAIVRLGPAVALLAGALRRLAPGFDAAVPVPAPVMRRWLRGHDPAAGLCALAVWAAGGPLPYARLLRRRGLWTRPQRGLPRDLRRRNVQGDFQVPPRQVSRVRGARILLVDDVVTTGATLAEARRALYAAGARRVACLALFRADL